MGLRLALFVLSLLLLLQLLRLLQLVVVAAAVVLVAAATVVGVVVVAIAGTASLAEYELAHMRLSVAVPRAPATCQQCKFNRGLRSGPTAVSDYLWGKALERSSIGLPHSAADPATWHLRAQVAVLPQPIVNVNPAAASWPNGSTPPTRED